MRIAIDIDSTLHHYWDQLEEIAHRRFGVTIPYADQVVWQIDRLKPEQLRAVVKESHSERHILGSEPYPGAVEAVRAWHEAGHFIHVTSHRAGEAHEATERWLRQIGLPYDELYCSYDKVTRCQEIGIDVLIDDSPENLRPRDRRRHHGGDAPASLEPRAVRDRGRRLRRRLGGAGAQPRAGARVKQLPAPSEDLRDYLPAIEPERQVSDWGRSERIEGALDKTLYDFLYHYWFRCDVEGIENVPADGGALLVSNHSGALPPDATMILKAVKEEHSRPRPVHLTVEHFFKGNPLFSMLVPKIGGVPAHPANVQRLLYDEGQLVLVFPEGRKGTEKLFKDRYRLRRFGRGGFVEAAMRAQVPIVPIALVGAEEAMPVFAQIGALQRLTGLLYFPITPTFPHFGLLGFLGYLPAKFRIRFLEPVPTDQWGPEPYNDRGLVQRVSDEIRGRVQDELYDMLAKRQSVWY